MLLNLFEFQVSIKKKEVVMNTAYIIHRAIGVLIITFLLSLFPLQPLQAQVSESGNSEPSERYSREEVAQMLAPIALYPDALLSQVLMASTYPIEVIEADRWVKRNPELKEEALDEALLTHDWAPSVKALCHFPPVLSLMSERIAETTNIGNAFLLQEDEVMNMIQELRVKAYALGNLSSDAKQNVVVEKETIIIEPADPMLIYVPYYNPYYVYGTWWYPTDPPYYWKPSSVIIAAGISYWPGFNFGFAFSTWSYFNWHDQYIYIDVRKQPRYVRYDRWRPKPGRWIHKSSHRRGFAYRDKSTARKFGQHPSRDRDFSRDSRRLPERRDQDRHEDGKIRTVLDKRGDDRTITYRPRQIHTRVVPDRQEKQRVERTQQVRKRVVSNGKEKQRVARNIESRESFEHQQQDKSRDKRGRIRR
jgi:hypothetical protein